MNTTSSMGVRLISLFSSRPENLAMDLRIVGSQAGLSDPS
jgi:hypothetical protein